MKLEDLLAQLSESEELGELKLDSNGICRILINENYLIAIERDLSEEKFFLYSNIGIIPGGFEGEIGLLALTGNLFGKETGNSHIGYVPQTRSLVLFQDFNEESTDFPTFQKTFREFVQYLVYWTSKLEKTINKNHNISSPEAKAIEFSRIEHKTIFFA